MNSKQQSSKKKLWIGIAVILVILTFSVIIFSQSNTKKYTYIHEGQKCTFAVDFNAGTYEYSGADFQKTSLGLWFKTNSSLKRNGYIAYIETKNGEKKYSFSGDWGYSFFLSEDEKTLSLTLIPFKLEN